MAVMTTTLKEFSNSGNSRTSTYSGHSALNPRLVIEKRHVPSGNQTMVEYSLKVVSGTVDADGLVLAQKVSFESVVRYPLLGQSSDVTAALAIFRDIIAGDEYGNSVTTQEWV